MNNNKNGKRYSDNFRKMVVNLYNSGYSFRDLSSKHGVSEVIIYSWIKKITSAKLEDGSSITPDGL